MPDSVPPAVAKSFAALIPAVLTLSIFTVLNAIVTVVFNTNLHDVIYNIIQMPFSRSRKQYLGNIDCNLLYRLQSSLSNSYGSLDFTDKSLLTQ